MKVILDRNSFVITSKGYSLCLGDVTEQKQWKDGWNESSFYRGNMFLIIHFGKSFWRII